MNRQEAIALLKTLPKGKAWTTRRALSLTLALERDAFGRLSDYVEAVTAKRPSVLTHDLPLAVDGQGGILPAVLLSGK